MSALPYCASIRVQDYLGSCNGREEGRKYEDAVEENYKVLSSERITKIANLFTMEEEEYYANALKRFHITFNKHGPTTHTHT